MASVNQNKCVMMILRRSLKYVLIAVVSLVVLVVIGTVILTNLDFERFKPDVEALVKEKTGRELTIKGKLSPSFGLSPSFEVHDVTLQNEPWGSQATMAQAGEVKVVLALLPLLHKQVYIKELVIKDASLLLEENRKGEKNWGAFVSAEEEKGSGYTASIRNITLENVVAAYYKNGKEQTMLDVDTFSFAQKRSRITLNVAGIYNHVPLLLDGKVKNLSNISSEPLPLHGSLTAKNSSLVFEGQVDMTSEHPTVKGSLTGKGLKVEDFVPPAAETSKRPIFSSEPFSFGWLKPYVADVAIALETLNYGKAEFSNIQSTLTLQDGVISLSPLKATAMNGRLTGSVLFNTAANPPSLDISLNGERLHAATVAKQLRLTENLSDGGLSFNVTTKGAGNSFHAVASTLNGEANFYLEKAYYHATAGMADAEVFFKMLTGKKDRLQTEINCAAAVFDVKKGVARTRAMVLDSTGSLVKGKGDINFANETMSLLFTPQAKTVGIADLMIPMRLEGPLHSPSFRQDNKGLIKGLGKAALGFATGGTATLGFVALDMVKKLGIKAEGNVCLMAMSQRDGEEGEKLFPKLFSGLQ